MFELCEYDYTAEILSIVCPECCAAITGKCLVRKPTGGSEYRAHPHMARVQAAADNSMKEPNP
jgi:hypothetical protein